MEAGVMHLIDIEDAIIQNFINSCKGGRNKMKPIAVPETNCTYTAPDCFDVPVIKHKGIEDPAIEAYQKFEGGRDGSGIYSFWELTEEELNNIIKTKTIGLHFGVQVFPPTGLFVLSEEERKHIDQGKN